MFAGLPGLVLERTSHGFMGAYQCHCKIGRFERSKDIVYNLFQEALNFKKKLKVQQGSERSCLDIIPYRYKIAKVLHYVILSYHPVFVAKICIASTRYEPLGLPTVALANLLSQLDCTKKPEV